MDVWRTLRYLPTTTKSRANYRLRRKKVKVFGFSLNYREFFNEIFYGSLCLYLRKITNFIQLSLTMTKLCHVKRYHLVNFYISVEKCEKL